MCKTSGKLLTLVKMNKAAKKTPQELSRLKLPSYKLACYKRQTHAQTRKTYAKALRPHGQDKTILKRMPVGAWPVQTIHTTLAKPFPLLPGTIASERSPNSNAQKWHISVSFVLKGRLRFTGFSQVVPQEVHFGSSAQESQIFSTNVIQEVWQLQLKNRLENRNFSGSALWQLQLENRNSSAQV